MTVYPVLLIYTMYYCAYFWKVGGGATMWDLILWILETHLYRAGFQIPKKWLFLKEIVQNKTVQFVRETFDCIACVAMEI